MVGWLGCGGVHGQDRGCEAQTYPNRVIKIIVPFTPGSPVDATARVADPASADPDRTKLHHRKPRRRRHLDWHQGGRHGAARRLHAAAQRLVARSTFRCSIRASTTKLSKVSSRSRPLVTWSHVIVVAPSVPVRTLAELVAYAKANPGKVVFGFGQGTAPHILGKSLAARGEHRSHHDFLSRRRSGARRSARRARRISTSRRPRACCR